MELKISDDQCDLVMTSGKGAYKIHFDHKIHKWIPLENKAIVLLDTLGSGHINKKNSNIYCVNDLGVIVWQVQDPDSYRPGKPKSSSPFTGIRVEGSVLKASNWDSSVYTVDLATGRLSDAGWTK